jgi:hypothetical protein
MLLAEIQLINRVAIANGDGGNGVNVVAVEITCEHDASCLCHVTEYAAIEQKMPFAWRIIVLRGLVLFDPHLRSQLMTAV